MRPRSNLLRQALIWFTVISLVIQTGCVSVSPPPVPTTELRQRLGTVTIVPAQYVPRTNFATFAKSKPTGAAKGAAVAGGTVAVVTTAMATPYTAILVPFFVAVGAASGAVAGTLGTMPAEKVQEIESAISGAVAKLDAQRALAERLTTIVQQENWIRLRAVNAMGPTAAAESPAYAALRPVGIDTVLEVAVSEIGFEDSGCGVVTGWNYDFCRNKTQKSLIFFMLAQARLVRVADGTELFARQFRYQSPWREAAQWAANDGRLLAEEFEGAYRDLADRINDEALLVTPIALPTPSIFLPWGDPLFGVCWLAPIYPKVERVSLSKALLSKPDDMCPRAPMGFGIVDSLRPRLRWSSFPRDLDRAKLDSALLHKISDVTYDLKIWEIEGCERNKLVYERTSLSAPEHQLENPLKPGQRYYWSFRARFTVNDQPMATHWAFFDPNGCYPNDITGWLYHRFITPK